MESDKIIYRPIGTIYSPFKKIKGVPIQPSAAQGIRGMVEIKKKFQQGLLDLDGFSHVILLYHFHRSRGYSLSVVPFMDKTAHGVFATRAPSRPNAIGLSVVKLLKIEKNILQVEDIDIINGTPLLDIKPYVKEFDIVKRVKIGWLTKTIKHARRVKSNGRFE